jgi:Flp pilus assembly protein CpaB
MAADVKPRSNRLLMVLGIVLMVVAFLAVILINPGKGGGGGGGSTTVVESAVDIPAGTQISEQLLKTVTLPADQVPVGAFNATRCAPKGGACTDPLNQYAALALPKSTVLTSSNLVASQSALPPVKKPYLDIPSGQVAVQIPAGGELVAAGGFIQPDDRVDILATGLPGMKASTWKIVYQNVVIAHVGGVASANTQGITSSYTLFVNVDDAENLEYLFASGQVKFLLKSQKDAKPEDKLGPGSDAGVSTDTFNAKFSIPR